MKLWQIEARCRRWKRQLTEACDAAMARAWAHGQHWLRRLDERVIAVAYCGAPTWRLLHVRNRWGEFYLIYRRVGRDWLYVDGSGAEHYSKMHERFIELSEPRPVRDFTEVVAEQ